MTSHPFIKMHGAGNDFIVLDHRDKAKKLTERTVAALAQRRLGIGCDQLIVMEPSDKADVFMRIYNADGSEIDACGNASRCIAWLILEESSTNETTLETGAGILSCTRAGDHQVTVDMGQPRFEWDEIPLSEPRNTMHLGLQEGLLMDPTAVNVGNPHMIFFVKNLDAIRMDVWGKALETNPLFPERANISAAQLSGREHIKLTVWERGAGLTLACGTAACAAVVAGVLRDLCERHCAVELPGGTLDIEWNKDSNHLLMTGPVATVFAGSFDEALIA